ncbi:MAG: hypothetical protein KC503_36855 [Myxococcales bacterium]|nr:hypothetical protein [Myxococcales bacterium]
MKVVVFLMRDEVGADRPLDALYRELAESGGAFECRWHIVDRFASIDCKRSHVMTRAMQEAAERGEHFVTVQVDHDVAWEPGGLLRLARHCETTRGVVGAIVPMRGFQRGFGGRICDGQVHVVGSDELVRLGHTSYVGGAMVAIHTEAITRIAERLELPLVSPGFIPFAMPMIDSEGCEPGDLPDYLYEDWALVKRAHQAGVPVHAYLGVMTTHHGATPFTAETAVRPDERVDDNPLAWREQTLKEQRRALRERRSRGDRR